MRITAGGLVGIGLTNPGSTLHVLGADANPGSGYGTVLVCGGDANHMVNIGYSKTGNYGWLQAVNSGTGYTNLCLQQVAGSVCIGTTTPQAPLTVWSSVTGDVLNLQAGIGSTGDGPSILLQQNNASVLAARIKAAYNGTLNSVELVFQTFYGGSMTERVRINNVGLSVNYALPAAPLHVYGTSTAPSATAATPTAVGMFQFSIGTQLRIGGYNAAPYSIWLQAQHTSSDNAYYPIVLNPLGGVGVGIGKNPSYILDVNGDCNISGTYRVNGTPLSTGAGMLVQNNGAAATGPHTYFNFQPNGNMTWSLVQGGPSNNTMQIQAIYNASDARLKMDVKDLAGGLPLIGRLKPKEFRYNGCANLSAGLRGVSLIAQDLQEISAVSVRTWRAKLHPDDEEETDLLNYDPTEIVMHLVLAIQQLEKRLRALEPKAA
jgi:hypothetical protein